MGQIVSGVRVSVSFQGFALRMFVCLVMFFAILSAVTCAIKLIPLSHLSCHVLGNPTMAPLRVIYGHDRYHHWRMSETYRFSENKTT